MQNSPENVEVLQQVVAVLDRLEIAYAVAGSWASSLFGKPRLTNDADLMVEAFSGKEATFCAAFDEDFYLSMAMIQDAIRRRTSFNVIHWPSGFKVDLFIRKARRFDASILSRRRAFAVTQPDGPLLTFVSAEDLILLKMEWYRLGGGSSERQWLDILGVFQTQTTNLDLAYLNHWADDLGVRDLIQRARQESGV